MRISYRDRLRDSAADVMPYHAREVDSKEIQDCDETISVCPQPDAGGARRITASEPEQVEDDDSVPCGEQGNNGTPEVS